MKIEKEVKIRLNTGTFYPIICDRKNKGLPLKFYKQKNIIFQNNKGFFRIRYENNKVILTYKGKNTGEKINCREERESILEGAGYTFFEQLREFSKDNSFYYEKNRANIYLTNCIISLDELSHDKKYIEIEGEEKEIMKNLKILGLQNYPLEKRNYLEILMEDKNLFNKCEFEKNPKAGILGELFRGDYLLCKKTGKVCVATDRYSTGHSKLESQIQRENMTDCKNYSIKRS